MRPSPIRVAFRYLSSTPSPSAMKLLKVMASGAGKTSTLNINLLSETLGLLGWTVQEGIGARPLSSPDQLEHLLAGFLRTTRGKSWGYDGVKEPKEFWYISEEAATVARAALLREVDVVEKVGPTPPVVGKLYVHRVGLPVEDERVPGRWRVVSLLWWLGVPSWSIRTPTGDEITLILPVDSRGRLGDPTAMQVPSFWTWGYRNGLQEAARAAIERLGVRVVEEATRPPSSRSLEDTGTCPACFANVKLSGGAIMRHGWQVQGQRGWGQYGSSWHSAACFGFHWEPFEVSKKGTEEYLKVVRSSLDRAQQALQGLRRLPESLEFLNRRKQWETVNRPEGFRFGPTDTYPRGSYGDVLQNRMREVASDIRGMEELQRTLEARIVAWTPQPLPGTR